MIYRKNANFPYPVLSNLSNSYELNHFDLDVDIKEQGGFYYFEINYEIDSDFIKNLLNNNRARLVFIIQSKDNKFYFLETGQSDIRIPKNRISLNKRTSIQLHIQALESISFVDNHDLSEFYRSFKEELILDKHALLGYSNVVVFDGDIKKPLELFAKKLNEDLKSEIRVELGQETIIIHYKKRDFQLDNYKGSKALSNMYIYLGLSKALQSFITNNSPDNDGDVDLEDIPEPTGSLDFKIYHLMKDKAITDLNMDNIDEVISIISDRMIERFTSAVGEAVADGS